MTPSGGAGAICQIGILTRKRSISGPKMALLAEFHIYHVERILASKYYKIQHWGMSLEDLLFPKKRRNLKGHSLFYSAKCLKMALSGPPKVHCFQVKMPI